MFDNLAWDYIIHVKGGTPTHCLLYSYIDGGTAHSRLSTLINLSKVFNMSTKTINKHVLDLDDWNMISYSRANRYESLFKVIPSWRAYVPKDLYASSWEVS